MTIDKNNYEEYLLSYVDGELDDAAAAALRRFLQANPDKQKELDLLQMTVLPAAPAIIFPDKALLYRREDQPAKKIFILRHYKWISAVAAACIALWMIFYPGPEKSASPPVAAAADALHQKVKQPLQTISPDTVSAGEMVKQKQDTKPALAVSRATSEKPAILAWSRQRTAPPSVKDNKAIADVPGHPPLPVLPAVNIPPAEPSVNEPLAMARPDPRENKKTIRTTMQDRRQKDNLFLPGEKITDAAEAVSMVKEDINDAITQKLTDLNSKASGLIDHVKEKGIRIGKVTFAFNN